MTDTFNVLVAGQWMMVEVPAEQIEVAMKKGRVLRAPLLFTDPSFGRPEMILNGKAIAAAYPIEFEKMVAIHAQSEAERAMRLGAELEIGAVARALADSLDQEEQT